MSIIQPIRSSIYRSKIRRQLRNQAKNIIAEGQLLKVVIGAGTTAPQGFLATDRDALYALNESDWESAFSPSSIHRILAEHVIEHWSEQEFRKFLAIARKFLADRGVIRLA